MAILSASVQFSDYAIFSPFSLMLMCFIYFSVGFMVIYKSMIDTISKHSMEYGNVSIYILHDRAKAIGVYLAWTKEH